MQRFLLNENTKMASLLSSLSEVMTKYNQKDLDTSATLNQFLNDAIGVFNSLGQPDNETWTQGLKTKLVTAESGVNPDTLESQKLGRRTMQRNTCFEIMQDMETGLRTMYSINKDKISQAEEVIRQIIIAGFQAKILDDKKIKHADDLEKIEDIWDQLSSDANISIGQKKVLLMINKYDALILLGDLFNALS